MVPAFFFIEGVSFNTVKAVPNVGNRVKSVGIHTFIDHSCRRGIFKPCPGFKSI